MPLNSDPTDQKTEPRNLDSVFLLSYHFIGSRKVAKALREVAFLGVLGGFA
jgi:hypothetical protein